MVAMVCWGGGGEKGTSGAEVKFLQKAFCKFLTNDVDDDDDMMMMMVYTQWT